MDLFIALIQTEADKEDLWLKLRAKYTYDKEPCQPGNKIHVCFIQMDDESFGNDK